MKKRNLISLIACLSSILLVGCVDKNPSDNPNDTGSKNTTNTDKGEKDVTAINVTSEKNLELKEGAKSQISYTLAPEDATNKLVNFTSSDDDIASVNSNGVITARKASNNVAVITITSISNPDVKATINVTVKEKITKVSSITTDKDELNLKVGAIEDGQDRDSINCTVLPDDAEDKSISFESADESVAIVTQKGLVVAQKEGNTQITITSVSNTQVSKIIPVHVTKVEPSTPPVVDKHVTAITASPKNMVLKLGSDNVADLINVTFAPADLDSSKKGLTFSSEHPEIATVGASNGLVTAKSKGSTTITITSVDNTNAKDTITVVVEEADPIVDPTPVKKAITSVELSGLASSYGSDDTINWDDSRLKVTYDDESIDNLERSERDPQMLDDGTYDIKQSTQFILLTSGLSSQSGGHLIVHDYEISVIVVGYEEDDEREVATINVINSTTRDYKLEMFDEPTTIKAFKTNVNNATGESEGYFKQKQQYYTIGDDNEFVIKPDVLVKEKKNPTVTATIPVKLSVKVNELDAATGTPSSLPADSSIYTFNTQTSGFKFTSAAVGKKYRLSYQPKDFDQVNGDDVSLSVKTLDVEVKDGFNAYSSLDLGRINLMDAATKALADPITQRCYDGLSAKYNDQQRENYFYDENNADGHNKYLNLSDLWTTFLQRSGKNDLHEINGLFMHNDMYITPNDIPSEYMITESEAIARCGDSYAQNTLRDRARLYTHLLVNSDFTLNGNCFKLDTQAIPLCKSNSECDTFTYTQNQSQMWMGHATVFEFANTYEAEYNKDGQLNSDYNAQTAKKAYIDNISAYGNTGGVITGLDPSAIKNASGGLIFYDSCYGVSKINNLQIRNFMIGVNGEGEYSNKTMEVSNTKIYDCFNSAIFCWATENNIVNNCEFKRFGGPAIFLNSLERVKNKGQTNSFSMYGKAGITVNDSVIESYVNGTEAWFVVNQATTAATQITGAFSQFMNMYQAPILVNNPTSENNGKMNMPILGLDSAYIGTGAEPVRINYQRDNYKPFNTYDRDVKTDSEDVYRTASPTIYNSGSSIIQTVNINSSKDQFGYAKSDGDDKGFHTLIKASGSSTYTDTLQPPSQMGGSAIPTGKDLSGDYVYFFMKQPQTGADIAMVLQIQK